MRVFYIATRPLVDLFNGIGNLVLKPFGIPPASEAGSRPTARTSCASCCARAAQGGLIESDEQQLSDAALVFGDVPAREAMIPRAEIDDVQLDDDVHAVAAGGHRDRPHAAAGAAARGRARGRGRGDQRQGPAAAA